jgi:RimJ/RimL family protein N-acetyltransferase
LQLLTPRLRLALPDEDDLDALAHAAVGNIFEPRSPESEYMGPWTQLPPGDFERNFIQHHWRLRGQWQPQDWKLELGVYPQGGDKAIGMMGLAATDLAANGCVHTGSWLLPPWRGRGLGQEMRTAVLVLAFEKLGASEAQSSADPNNRASLGVSRALGYEDDGYECRLEDRKELRRVRLRREQFRPACEVEIEGYEECSLFFQNKDVAIRKSSE